MEILAKWGSNPLLIKPNKYHLVKDKLYTNSHTHLLKHTTFNICRCRVNINHLTKWINNKSTQYLPILLEWFSLLHQYYRLCNNLPQFWWMLITSKQHLYFKITTSLSTLLYNNTQTNNKSRFLSSLLTLNLITNNSNKVAGSKKWL